MTFSDATDTLQTAPVRSRLRWRILSLLAGAITVATAACNGGLPMPSRDVAQGQSMLDLADALNQIREQSAGLQEQIDSLRDVVARQDTIIRQLALTAGITFKPQ